jgi:dihydrodipicolinate synthase/N-acetylneuraminate lyase
MRTSPLSTSDLRGVFPVPPLARRPDRQRTLDFAENERLVRHMAEGGMTRFLYGGNAFLYHITLAEYEELLDWLVSLPDNYLVIPSAGPSYGRAIDQAPLVRRHRFPAVMMLPCADPRDAAGLERGIREIAEAAATPLILYLKDESNFGADKEAGLDAVARLVQDGLCVAIKYAVVRPDPRQDPYLESLLRRVDRSKVISGIGERPAVAHLQYFGLPGFTTGSGCVAPRLSNEILAHCHSAQWTAAEELRRFFLPLEDLRDAWGPSRVLHAAVQVAGLCAAGPVQPFVSPLSDRQLAQLTPVARALAERNAAVPA